MSGIYIKGMEMPEMRQAYAGLIICWNGEVFPFIPPQGYELGENVATAVPVPDHGRLVDADVLRSMCDDHHWRVWMSDIADAPTVIPASKEGEK